MKWILEEASGSPRPRGLLPARFSNCTAPTLFSSAQVAVWFPRVSALLPFKPLCMSTVTRERTLSLSLSLLLSEISAFFLRLPSRTRRLTITTGTLRKVVWISEVACVRVTFRVLARSERDLSSLSLSLFLSVSRDSLYLKGNREEATNLIKIFERNSNAFGLDELPPESFSAVLRSFRIREGRYFTIRYTRLLIQRRY